MTGVPLPPQVPTVLTDGRPPTCKPCDAAMQPAGGSPAAAYWQCYGCGWVCKTTSHSEPDLFGGGA